MKIEKCLSYIDKYCWRCRSNGPKHDIKINIRIGSFFESMRVPLNALYYLIYNCFLNQFSINRAYNEMVNFSNILETGTISQHLIIKIFREVRKAIKMFLHKKWDSSKLGMEPAENGKARIEIDESKIIANAQSIIWMFGLIDRADKKARIFCVMKDRTRNNLLDIVKKNVYTLDPNEDDEMKTRIYSDYFSSYQVRDFYDNGYILNKVNHSVWFGQGLFHTNTVEGLWSQIKRISHDFSGLNFKLLDEVIKDGEDAKEYIDNWICSSLFFRDCEMKKYTMQQKRDYLTNVLCIKN